MRILGRILLVAALLSAQTAGMAHELWHATTLAADSDGAAKTPKGSPLCDFHAALASVLGAIHGDAPAIGAVAALRTAFIAADVPAARLSPLAPRSRAPPALL
jgi:hypothetical protein